MPRRLQDVRRRRLRPDASRLSAERVATTTASGDDPQTRDVYERGEPPNGLRLDLPAIMDA